MDGKNWSFNSIEFNRLWVFEGATGFIRYCLSLNEKTFRRYGVSFSFRSFSSLSFLFILISMLQSQTLHTRWSQSKTAQLSCFRDILIFDNDDVKGSSKKPVVPRHTFAWCI